MKSKPRTWCAPTQTAGSIIRPAAFFGVVGYKPSLGRVTSAGVKSLSPSLDVVGGFGRSVCDVGLLGAALSGDLRLANLGEGAAVRIGLCPTPHWDQVDHDTRQAWAQAVAALAPQAAHCVEVVMPQGFESLLQLQKDVMAFEMARALSHERLAHSERMSARLRDLMNEGIAISGEIQANNLNTTAQWRLKIDALFERHDVLLTPSAIGEAPAGTSATGDPMFCRSWSLLGLPSVHLPFFTGSHGLPIGLQLVGRFGQDHQLLAAAHWVHQRLTG
ncbi:MAG: amidase [Burkholderiaceae bacterium]